MDDLISRKDAIDALGEEPIVWDEWKDEYNLGMQTLWVVAKRDIESLPSVDVVLQWIPCEERLPNEDEDVIVSIKGIGVRIGYLESYCMGGEWCQRWWWYDECFEDDEFELIEAWMPFPKPYERKE